jgi:hypothetical protein
MFLLISVLNYAIVCLKPKGIFTGFAKGSAWQRRAWIWIYRLWGQPYFHLKFREVEK